MQFEKICSHEKKKHWIQRQFSTENRKKEYFKTRIPFVYFFRTRLSFCEKDGALESLSMMSQRAFTLTWRLDRTIQKKERRWSIFTSTCPYYLFDCNYETSVIIFPSVLKIK